MDSLLTPKEAAHILGLTTNTLKQWRSGGRGMTFIRVGKSIRYELKDVTEWIEKHKCE